MKRIILTLTALFTLCNFHFAAGQEIKELEDSRYSLSLGDVTMIIDARDGGKIISYALDGKEALAQEHMTPFSYGSTFWSSPQKEWSWPPVVEYDSQPYEAEIRANSLFLTSRVSPKFKYRFTKEFSIDKKAGAIAITYSIINESDVEKKVAPWEISRVPGAGVMFCDADLEDISPAGTLPFRVENGLAWYPYDTSSRNRKVNIDGTGWLAYSHDGLLFIHQYEDLDKTQPAPDEAEIQIYVNIGRTYIELEGQGEYTKLQPGDAVRWTVRWYLVSHPYSPLPSKELAELAQKTLNSCSRNP